MSLWFLPYDFPLYIRSTARRVCKLFHNSCKCEPWASCPKPNLTLPQTVPYYQYPTISYPQVWIPTQPAQGAHICIFTFEMRALIVLPNRILPFLKCEPPIRYPTISFSSTVGCWMNRSAPCGSQREMISTRVIWPYESIYKSLRVKTKMIALLCKHCQKSELCPLWVWAYSFIP